MKKSFFFSLLSTISLITACTPNSYIEDRFYCFNAYNVTVRLYDGSNDNLSDLVNILKLYDKLGDNYLERDITNVSSINKTNEEMTIDNALYKMLEKAYSVPSEGADKFSILCGSLSKKWKESLANKIVLSDQVIQEELEKMNSSSLLFKGNNIVQRVGDAEIDLGGFVKGYALDMCKEYLVENQINNYLIDGARSSILLGKKPTNNGYFEVGLDEFLPRAYLNLRDCFISTSAITRQGVKIDGVTYSHIVDPDTGSVINKQDGVIVINDKGYLGDALSTSLMMNTVEEIVQKENDLNIKTIVFKDGKTVHTHPGLTILYH